MPAENQSAPAVSATALKSHLGELWGRLPHKALLGVLLLAWIGLFHFLGNSTLGYVNTPSLFGWWYWVHTRGLEGNEGSAILTILNGEEAHAWIIPFVVLGLFWYRREEFLALSNGSGGRPWGCSSWRWSSTSSATWCNRRAFRCSASSRASMR
jgi:hypothetical protein